MFLCYIYLTVRVHRAALLYGRHRKAKRHRACPHDGSMNKKRPRACPHDGYLNKDSPPSLISGEQTE